jgi:signal transduction histidine kinase
LTTYNGSSHEFIDFLRINENIKSAKDLIIGFDTFIGHKHPSVYHTVLGHVLSSEPYQIIIDSNFAHEALKTLSARKYSKNNQKSKLLTIEGLNIFPICDSDSNVHCVVVFTNSSETEKENILFHCNNFQYLMNLILKQQYTARQFFLQSQANLVSHLSHDFSSLISLLKNEPLDNLLMKGKLDYSQRMINQLLQYVRELNIMRSKVSVNDLIAAVLQNHPIPDSLSFVLSTNEESTEISLDVELIDKAIAALLDNSIRATAQTGKKISMDIRKYENISIFIDHDWLMITIADNGPGIPNEYLAKITDPFFTTYKSQGHTGFGLAMAQKVIEAHGGALQIQNIKPSGTEVIINLPLENE